MKKYALVTILLFESMVCLAQDRTDNLSIILGVNNSPCDFQIGTGNKNCPVSSCLFPVVGYECLTGDYGIWYKSQCSSYQNNCNKLTKPFIVIEGFDPNNSSGLVDIYTQANGGTIIQGSVNVSNHHFLEDLRCDGWDIVVLNLQNNYKEIEKNARLVQRLIWVINQEVAANGSKHRPSALGISMGGLVLRYALAQWENEYPNIDHRVENMVTFDTPHKGANVPLGLQQMVQFLIGPQYIGVENQLNGIVPSVFNPKSAVNDFTNNYLNFWTNNPAANEMAANFAQPNLLRTEFVSNQLSNGDYPQRSYNIGTANGSSGIRNDYLNAGDVFFDWEAGSCVIDQTILGIQVKFCPFVINQTVRAMPGNGALVTYQGGAGAQLGINGVNIGTGQVYGFGFQGFPNMGGMIDPNIDHVPGGAYSLNFLQNLQQNVNNSSQSVHLYYQAQGVPIPCFTTCYFLGIPFSCPSVCYQNITLIDQTFNVSSPLGHIDGNNFVFTFVPTMSSLDISAAKNQDWFFNVNNIPGYPYPTDKGYTWLKAIHHFDRSMGNKYDISRLPRQPVIGTVNNNYFDSYKNSVNNSDHAVMANQNMANFLMEQISPDNLYIQNRTFPADYSNTFEARGFIAIGSNVAPPSLTNKFGGTGPVIMNGNPNINFSVPSGSFVYYDNGFDSGNANMEVLPNSLSSCNAKQAFTDNTAPQTGWSSLRLASADAISDVSPEPVPFQEKQPTTPYSKNGYVLEPIDFKSKFDRNETQLPEVGQVPDVKVIPNPFSEKAIFAFSVVADGNYTLTVSDYAGRPVAVLMENKMLKQGSYEINFNGSTLTSGVYLCKLVCDSKEVTVKAILLR